MDKWHDSNAFWKKTWIFQFDEQRWKDTKRDTRAMARLLGLKRGMRILDLCCGPGRATLPLAEMGYDMTGVDRTKPYLAHARREAKTRGLSCRFVHGDMRTFIETETYDVILSLFTSFGYFADQRDNQKVLDNIHASLKKGGKLVLEIRSREIYKRIFRPKDWEERRGVYLLKERIPRKNWTWLENPWIIIEKGRAYRFDVSHHVYGVEDLTAMFGKAGYSRVDLHGHIGGGRFDPETSHNLVAVAFK
jgi:SAM-dependent methyltransferase